jgi:hypothetical protein
MSDFERFIFIFAGLITLVLFVCVMEIGELAFGLEDRVELLEIAAMECQP